VPGNALGLLQVALESAEQARPLEEKLHAAVRAKVIDANGVLAQIDAAEEAGVLTIDEARQLRDLDEQIMALINVDDFDPSELGTKP